MPDAAVNMAPDYVLDSDDRRLINRLQEGIPLSDAPYAEVAGELGLTESDVINRLQRLLTEGYLSRFGPLFHAERLGGALTLAAMAVPPAEIEAVAARVNAFPQVAHNYARDHHLNMWFVLATETADEIAEVLRQIESSCGHPVFNMPKIEEFFVGLRLNV